MTSCSMYDAIIATLTEWWDYFEAFRDGLGQQFEGFCKWNLNQRMKPRNCLEFSFALKRKWNGNKIWQNSPHTTYLHFRWWLWQDYSRMGRSLSVFLFSYSHFDDSFIAQSKLTYEKSHLEMFLSVFHFQIWHFWSGSPKLAEEFCKAS